jgi:hypothetical protein
MRLKSYTYNLHQAFARRHSDCTHDIQYLLRRRCEPHHVGSSLAGVCGPIKSSRTKITPVVSKQEPADWLRVAEDGSAAAEMTE